MTVRAAADIRVYQSDCDNLKISSRTGAERYRQFGGTRPKTRLLVFKNEGETKMAEFFVASRRRRRRKKRFATLERVDQGVDIMNKIYPIISRLSDHVHKQDLLLKYM